MSQLRLIVIISCFLLHIGIAQIIATVCVTIIDFSWKAPAYSICFLNRYIAASADVLLEIAIASTALAA